MALFGRHPPQDHSLPFPNVEYRDFVVERIADLESAGHTVEYDVSNGTPGDSTPRVEVVLDRYPAGRHGLAPNKVRGSHTNLMAPHPSETKQQRRERREERRVAAQQPFTRGNSSLMSTPQPVSRSGTNMSMAPQVGSSADFSARIGKTTRTPTTTALLEEEEGDN